MSRSNSESSEDSAFNCDDRNEFENRNIYPEPGANDQYKKGNLNSLKYIFANLLDFETININIDSKFNFPFSDIINELRVLIRFTTSNQDKITALIARDKDTKDIEIVTDPNFTIIVFSNCRTETDQKLGKIDEYLSHGGILDTEIEDFPFDITFKLLTKMLLMEIFEEKLLENINQICAFSDILIANETLDKIRDGCKQNYILQNLKDLVVFAEQKYALMKLGRFRKALNYTEIAILEQYKQYNLKIFVGVLKKFQPKLEFKNVSLEKVDGEKKFSLKLFLSEIEKLRDKTSKLDSNELLGMINDTLGILEKQKLFSRGEELDCVCQLFNLYTKELENCFPVVSNVKDTVGRFNREFIIPTWSEVFYAIEDLQQWIQSNSYPSKVHVVKFGLNRVNKSDIVASAKHKFEALVKVKSSAQFMDQLELKVPVYRMRGNPRGICLIINNIFFDNDPKKTRRGANIDEKNLKNVFEQLEFRVIIDRDANEPDMVDRLEELKFQDMSCLVVFIMSHGNEEKASGCTYFETSDKKIVKVSSVLDRFTFKNCQYVQSKLYEVPKIFFFNICRGGDSNAASTKKPESDETSVPTDETVPNINHTLVAFSTAPGNSSKRYTKSGAIYISELCDVLRKNACDTNLQDMLIMVNESIKNRRVINDPQQTCCYENRGFKKFYFNPGLSE